MPGLFDAQTMYPQGNPQFQGSQMPSNMMPPQGGDMSVMRPAAPQEMSSMPQADVPPGNFEAPLGQGGIPTYVGNPTLDKYIHMFIGGA